MLKQLQADMKEAMKAREELRLSTLRMLISKLKYAIIDNDNEDLSEEGYLKVIKSQIKQRKDSIEQFRAAGREDSAKQEEAEMAVLETYLPEQLTGDALKSLIVDAIKESGAASMKEMGKVMKVLSSAHAGKYDGKEASGLVRELLGAG